MQKTQQLKWCASLCMVMKITFAQILFAVVFTTLTHAASEGRAQEIMERMVTIHAQNAELRNVLRDIEEQADVKFAYSQKSIRAERTIDVHINRQKLSSALSSLLDPLHIAYELINYFADPKNKETDSVPPLPASKKPAYEILDRR